MDALSCRLVNRAVGNPADAAALEITVSGPTLRFEADTVICLGGAPVGATVDERPLSPWTPVRVRAGEVLRVAGIEAAGCRAYLAVRGGLDVPPYLGSRSTFTLGKFGGHGGRPLTTGDVLHVGAALGLPAPREIPSACRPGIAHEWELGVLYGPHGAPDFFTAGDIEVFFSSSWEVHYNSSRTGVRLIGPKPVWARSDGGEAGLHPSNIHDNAYAIGAVDFTGDMPVILGPDGPSLGGFVCPATVVKAELWKLGQLRPNDRVRFRRMTPAEALRAEQAQETLIDTLQAPAPTVAIAGVACIVDTADAAPVDAPIVARLPGRDAAPAVVYRRAGDKYLLIEYGDLVLDLELRLRVHALMQWLETANLEGIVELTPGIRSLQVHYESRVLPLARLLEVLRSGEDSLASIDDMVIPTRVVRLPLSWDDAATQLAIAKYMQSVRADAPWCPSNIEWPAPHRGREANRLRCELPGAGPGRCVSRCAGGDTHRPAASPRDDQVQSCAYLDPRECGRHRRRVPLCLRHGGTRWLSVRGTHLPDVEHLPHDRGVLQGQALAAAILRSDPLPSGERR
jgi:urea carboxylase